MLESVRSAHVSVLTPLDDNITDLRFYRIWLGSCINGIILQNKVASVYKSILDSVSAVEDPSNFSRIRSVSTQMLKKMLNII